MHLMLLAVLITVSGQGHASAPPDMATVSFSIATNAQNAAQASSENNRRYSALVQHLKGLGIAESDIKTTNYNLSYTPPQPPQPSGTVREITGYFVNRGVNVSLHNLQLAGKAIDAAVEAGVTDVGGVSYGVSQTRPLFARALGEAVQDARSQAQSMAAAAGLHLVRIRSMQQGYPSAPAPVPMLRQMAAGVVNPPTDIQPTAVDANATVTIVYEAQ